MPGGCVTDIQANHDHEVAEALYVAHADRLPLADPEHGIRCAVHAASLFDALSGALVLADTDRPLGVAAALWHDVGETPTRQDHPRKTFDLLAATVLPEFTRADRMVIACAARYCRSPLPNIEHAGFGEMSTVDQRRVRRLSAIVRVAAALDASHLGVVERFTVAVQPDRVRLYVCATEHAEVERDQLRESAGAFRLLTRMALDVEVVKINVTYEG